MNNLDELDNLLSNQTVTADAWYDCMQEVAAAKTANFDESEWQELSTRWKTRGEDWQVKLAGMLGSVHYVHTVPILENMVKESTLKVASEAINSLEGMDGSDYYYIPGEEMLRKLMTIHDHEPYPILRETIESLQGRSKRGA